jgi:peptidoglycan/xylan/chitin deacetylase (PgdA/CDA1 family)
MIENPIVWPNGARCAVAFTFDMDADSILHVAHPKDSATRVASISMLHYGPKVAIPRILETYRRFEIKQTFFIPAWCIEQYPQAIEAIVEGGHEIAHHGYIHEHPNELTREEEAYWLDRGCDTIKRFTGQSPRGWRAPLYNMSEHSADLLIERGFSYDASLMGDDVPYLLRTGAGELVELPSSWALDDWPQYMHSIDLDFQMPIQSPQRAVEVFKAEFDAAWAYGALFVPVWHPFLSGRLSRWHEVSKLIEYMMAKGDVWFARMDEIAAHVQRSVASGAYKPRIDRLPYYQGPVKALK